MPTTPQAGDHTSTPLRDCRRGIHARKWLGSFLKKTTKRTLTLGPSITLPGIHPRRVKTHVHTHTHTHACLHCSQEPYLSWQNCLSDNSVRGGNVCSERARGHDVCGEDAWVAVPRVKTVATAPALNEVGRVDQVITDAGNATSYHILRKGY